MTKKQDNILVAVSAPKELQRHFVAVYGSLKKGFGNHRLIANSELVSKGITPPIFKMISFLAYPGILDGNKNIEVEVYSVDSLTFKRLDGLEGYPNFYNRKLVNILKEDKALIPNYEPTDEDILEAWIYYLDTSTENYYHSKPDYLNLSKTYPESLEVISWDKDKYN